LIIIIITVLVAVTTAVVDGYCVFLLIATLFCIEASFGVAFDSKRITDADI